MHMPSPYSNDSILEGDKDCLAKILWQRLNPESWPFKFEELPEGSVLVGGAIRDGLLDRLDSKPDLDFVVLANAIELTQKLAKQLGGKYILLDSSRDIARLILEGWTIDFAGQSDKDLQKDLYRRDYRLNAIALTMEKNPRVIDPIGGIEDVRQKKLVAISENNLIEDPLRLLRALRLMAEHDLSAEPKTLSWLQYHAGELVHAAPERIQTEINKLVVAASADNVIPLLMEIGLLKFWQNAGASLQEAPALKDLQTFFNPRELSLALPLARLTYLLSDEGLVALRFSKRQCQRCKSLRKWQERNDSLGFRSLSEDDRLRLHEDLENDLPALILSLPEIDQLIWMQRWRNLQDPLFHPSSPVDGHTLQQSLDLPSGLELGRLIRYLCHERAFGRLLNREDSINAARYWWQRNQTLL